MDINTIVFIIGAVVLGLVVGILISRVREKTNATVILKNAKREADNIIAKANSDGDSLKKDKIFQAKEKFLELKTEHEKVILSRDKKMAEAEKRIRDKESGVSSELAKSKNLNKSLDAKINDYEKRLDHLNKRKEELDKITKRQVQQLEVISGISAEEAKAQLVESLRDEAKTDVMGYMQEKLEEAQLTAEQEAKKIIINTIHLRYQAQNPWV